jgi:predicted Zn-dependent peptidase
MNTLRFDRIGETVFSAKLANGLQIFVVPKKDFQKSYAFFATKYGSIDTKFQLDGVCKDTPAGVAHFLEHKMFDTKEGNALQELSQNGASPNAFTSFYMTAYHFESTDKFEENLKILLDFVSCPGLQRKASIRSRE